MRGSAAHGFSRRGCVAVLVLLAAALGLRVAAMAGMLLVPEEAYYWMYSQHPSLSYFDHPPMVAWVIGLGTGVFGNTEFGVRFVGALLMLGASGLMFVFGRMWFGRGAALVAAVLLQALPVYFGAGLIATMDSALVFFWLVGMVGASVGPAAGGARGVGISPGWGWGEPCCANTPAFSLASARCWPSSRIGPGGGICAARIPMPGRCWRRRCSRRWSSGMRSMTGRASASSSRIALRANPST